jgi:polyhydroxybutyrate depolymerase
MFQAFRTISAFSISALAGASLIGAALPAHAGKGCQDLTAGAGMFLNETLVSGGIERSYLLYVPSTYKPNRPMPIVLNFHGLGSSGIAQFGYTEMSALAEKFKFILVAPNGLGNSWNGGACCGFAAENDIDDVGFASDLIDAISASYCVNPDRVYATGISNGGFMSYRLACDLADRIAAIGPVAAANLTFSCEPSRPVPVIALNGTDDVLVSYAGGQASLQAWAAGNGCSGETTVTDDHGDATCVAYQDCEEDATAELCTIDGGGHNWPGAIDLFELDPILYWWAGHTSQDIDASREIWKFFAEHPMPGAETD